VAGPGGPFQAAFSQLERQVAPGDEIIARFWGLAGWSLNWLLASGQVLGLALVVPFILGLRHLYPADLALCLPPSAVLQASLWTRPALVIAVTRQRQLLCCRISRPFRRTAISQAPMETASLTGLRRGWPYSQLRYCGPGTDARKIRVNVPNQCRQAAETVTGAASGIATD
jgi:hypothetical protein